VVDWGEVTSLSTIIEAPHTRRMLATSVNEIAKVAYPYPFDSFLEVISPVFVSSGRFVREFHDEVVHDSNID
jgi:hypothetical protein